MFPLLKIEYYSENNASNNARDTVPFVVTSYCSGKYYKRRKIIYAELNRKTLIQLLGIVDVVSCCMFLRIVLGESAGSKNYKAATSSHSVGR